jgi:hypothetical protein
MGKKATVIKFDTIDKSRIKGRVGHTRTGACTSRGKCYHGMKPNPHKGKK